MGSFQLNLLNFLTAQKTYVADTVRERRLSFAFLGYFLGAFSLAFFANINKGSSIIAFIAQVVIYFITASLAGLFFAAVTQLFLDLTTKQGNGPGLFALIGLSEFAKTLLIAGALICYAAKGTPAVSALMFLAVMLIQIIFLISMVSHAYNTQKGVVFFSFVLTIIPSLLAFIFMVILLAAVLVGLIAGLA